SAPREDKAGVEEKACGGEEDRGGRGADPCDCAARRRDRDAGEDEAVAKRPAAERRKRDDDNCERAERVPEHGDETGGPEVEVFLRLRNRGARHGRRQRDGNRDPDREPAGDEGERRGPATSGQEEGADAEKGRREKAAAEVVNAEGAIVPAPRGAPREGARGDGVGQERGRPCGELRRAPRAPAAEQIAGKPEREERGGEREQCLHGVS